VSAEKRDAVRIRVDEIAGRNAGRIKLEDVIEDARNEESPLHDYFTWDDAKAAHKQRLDEARTLLRSINVPYEFNLTEHQVIAYVRDPAKPEKENGYISTVVLRTDHDLARAALVEEFSRAAAAMRRAIEVAKALDLYDEVAAQLDAIEALKARVISQQSPGVNPQ
jgi:hypothetical protein